MSPKAIIEMLKVTIPARLPVLVKGAPGVGKSDVIEQACSLLSYELMISHPVTSDPTDPKGMPAVVEGNAMWLPFGDLKKAITAKKPLVWFLDDLGQAAAAVQASYMQLLLARRVGEHKLSDKVTMIAATNRREDKCGVTGILECVKGRFDSIVELTPTVDNWCEWARTHSIAPEVIAFVRFRPALLHDTNTPTNDIVNRPSPRTVAKMAGLFKLGIRDVEALAGAVGPTFASEFLGFVRIYEALPSIDGILLKPATADIPRDNSALYAVVTALTHQITASNASAVMTYITRLPDEFAAMGVREATKVQPKAANCKAYIDWVSTHQNVLL